jgi:hypothetical protein
MPFSVRTILQGSLPPGPQGIQGIQGISGNFSRINSTTSISSPLSFDSDEYEVYAATSQSNDLTISADAGNPEDGRKIIFRFTCDINPRTITFTGGNEKTFLPVGVDLTASDNDFTYELISEKNTYFGCIYNSASNRWEVVALSQET